MFSLLKDHVSKKLFEALTTLWYAFVTPLIATTSHHLDNSNPDKLQSTLLLWVENVSLDPIKCLTQIPVILLQVKYGEGDGGGESVT